MLAIVEPARSVRGPIIYNEEKVSQEQARFLDAHNFLQDKEELTLRDELQRFRNLADLNERSQKKGVHLSVNFSPDDDLTDKEMRLIANELMQAIDFGDQPYLVYRHTDVAHPHMHIVTTNIRPDGSRISNDLRSPYHLKQVCARLEESHHLHHAIGNSHRASLHKPLEEWELHKHPGSRTAQYGEKPTKTTIADILDYVHKRYGFTSFEAYNALLSMYNVRADRGREDSPMYRNRGLYYRLIDEDGKKLGAPIKASAFNLPVTLDKLEEKFRLNQERVLKSIPLIQYSLSRALPGSDGFCSIETFREDIRQKTALVIPALRERRPRDWPQRIAGILDKSKPASERPPVKPDDGHGFFYVDWSYMNIVRDTEVGKEYTAAAILEKTGIEKEIRRMHQDGYFKLSNIQDKIFQPDFPDTAETRRLMLKLSPRHDDVVEKQLELQYVKELNLRQSRGLHM